MRIFLSVLCLVLWLAVHVRSQELNLLPKPQKVTLGNDTIKVTKIVVDYVDELPGVEVNKEEAYSLTVSADGVFIQAVSEQGIYRARQTLTQLAFCCGKDTLYPTCQITDWPAFRMRGLMQDVGRSYISMAELKREIDLLSRCLLYTSDAADEL